MSIVSLAIFKDAPIARLGTGLDIIFNLCAFRLTLYLLLLIVGTHATAFQYFDSPGTYPHGLTTDGTNLWNSDYASKMIYELNATGAVINSFSFSYDNPRGLAYTNGMLYAASGSTIYLLNATNGSFISSFSAPNTSAPNTEGLALGGGLLWVSDLNSAKIYGLNPANGHTIITFNAPSSAPRGLVYYGGTLWNLDSTANKLFDLSPADGSVLSTYPIPLESPRGLSFFDGSFIMADNEVDLLMNFDTTNTFCTVYPAPFQYYAPGYSLWVPYLSSQPLNQTNLQINRILIFQHGIEDDAVEYFADARFAAKSAGQLTNTLIISLQFLYASSDLVSTPPASLLYWQDSGDARFWGGFSAGSTATYPRAQQISSYSLLDDLLYQLTTNVSQFPALQEIVVAGHSGGGQFANRYAVTSTFPEKLAALNRGVDMIYTVMNPSTCVYFDQLRYNPATFNQNNGMVNFINPTSPPSDYNNYGYGLADLSGFQYPNDVGSNNIVTQYPDRKVIYLQGTLDTGTNDLDMSPEAMLDGTNRYERSFIYYAHLKSHFGTNNLPRHSFAYVPGIGHDAFGMITSPAGLRHVFQNPMRINQIVQTGQSAVITWNGGDGLANVQSSTNLQNWSLAGPQETSPFADTNANPAALPQRFYRLNDLTGP